MILRKHGIRLRRGVCALTKAKINFKTKSAVTSCVSDEADIDPAASNLTKRLLVLTHTQPLMVDSITSLVIQLSLCSRS
jgi:hypothetical protein